MSDSALSFLQSWYESQCDEEWEHEFGVKIDTLDNPGWHVTVDLVDTDAEGRTLPRFEAAPSDRRWMSWSSDGRQFMAACDPLSLEDVLVGFRDFIVKRGGMAKQEI